MDLAHQGWQIGRAKVTPFDKSADRGPQLRADVSLHHLQDKMEMCERMPDL